MYVSLQICWVPFLLQSFTKKRKQSQERFRKGHRLNDFGGFIVSK